MQYAIPASSDKSADAVVYALIIRFEVSGQESEVGGSTRVCVPKHYQHWTPKSAELIATGKPPFDAPERRIDSGANLGAFDITQHVPRAAA